MNKLPRPIAFVAAFAAFSFLNSCAVVTVPVKVAGAVATTTVKTAGTIVQTGAKTTGAVVSAPFKNDNEVNEDEPAR